MASNDVKAETTELRNKVETMNDMLIKYKTAVLGALVLAIGGGLWSQWPKAPAPTMNPAHVGYNGTGGVPWSPAPAPVAAAPAAPAPALVAPPIGFTGPAAAPLAMAQPLAFVVASGGQSNKTGLAYLNSMPDYKMAGNNSISFPIGTADPKTLVGRTVTASGAAVRNFSGGTTINVSSPAMIRVQ